MIYMRLKSLLQILQYKEHDILKKWSSGQVVDKSRRDDSLVARECAENEVL
jgi:hypothetical protein